MTPERYDDDKHTKSSPDRLCACGCGKPIDRATANSKYRFECKKMVERKQADKYRAEKREKEGRK